MPHRSTNILKCWHIHIHIFTKLFIRKNRLSFYQQAKHIRFMKYSQFRIAKISLTQFAR